jgi:hypothetical protein
MTIEQDYHCRVPISRVLTHTEIQLLSFCNDEREAVALAKIITLPANASYEMIEQAVTAALASVLEKAVGVSQIEYIGGRLANRWKETS